MMYKIWRTMATSGGINCNRHDQDVHPAYICYLYTEVAYVCTPEIANVCTSEVACLRLYTGSCPYMCTPEIVYMHIIQYSS